MTAKKNSQPPVPATTTPSPARQHSRDLGQLQLNGELRREAVEQLWGPPDAIEGSGVEHLVYTLDNGSSLGLRFDFVPPYGLILAVLTEPGQQTATVLFEAKPDR